MKPAEEKKKEKKVPSTVAVLSLHIQVWLGTCPNAFLTLLCSVLEACSGPAVHGQTRAAFRDEGTSELRGDCHL